MNDESEDQSMNIETKIQKYKIKLRYKKNIESQENIESRENIETAELDKKNTLIEIPLQNKEQFIHNFFQNIKVQKLLEIVGEQGKYHIYLMTVLCLFNFFYAFVGFQLGYIYYKPDFYCLNSDQSKYLCSENLACKNPYGYLVESPINSLVTEFKLYCDRHNVLRESEGIFVFLGGFIAFVFGVLSDVIGRRRVFLFAWLFSVVGTFVAIVSSSLTFVVIGNVFSWAGMDMFFSMVFVYTNEIIGGNLRSRSNAILFFFWGFGEIVINLVNIGISNYKTNFIIQFISLFILGLGLYYIKESPYVLYKLKNVRKLYKVLLFIANKNEMDIEYAREQIDKEFKIDLLQIESVKDLKSLRIKKKEKEKFSQNHLKKFFKPIKKICSNKQVVKRMIGVIILSSNIYIGYTLSILIPQRLGLANIYLNGVFLGVSELLGNFIIIPFGNKLKRRHLNFFCAFSITICALFLIVLDVAGDSDSSGIKWTQTLISSLIKLIYCMNFALIFSYASELFPTKIRGLTLGIIVLFGRISSLFSLNLVFFTDSLGLHPMVGVIISSIIAIPTSLLMPETIGKGVSN